MSAERVERADATGSQDVATSAVVAGGADSLHSEAQDFHIVAIGASAGGLDSLEKLFARVPTDTGMAFIVLMISKTLDGIVTTWNGGAARLYGYTAEEAIGHHAKLSLSTGAQGGDRRSPPADAVRPSARSHGDAAPAQGWKPGRHLGDVLADPGFVEHNRRHLLTFS